MKELEKWEVFLIVGAINDHWWMGSQIDAETGLTSWNPDECGPCSAVQDMPPEIRRQAVKQYEELTKNDGSSYYWDSERQDFKAEVDFTKPADLKTLMGEDYD